MPTTTPVVDGRAPGGLRIPPKFSFEHLLGSPRIALQRHLLQQPGARSQDYGEQVDDILALLRGTYRSEDGVEAHVVPGEGADVQVWILGSSGGQSAEVAGRHGLHFAANYHVSPGSVLEAVDGYRAAFQPGGVLDKPYVSVSADVVVAQDDARARELAIGYAPGSAASGPPRAPSSSPPPDRPGRTRGRRRTGRWWPTGSRPSSSARRSVSPTSWSSSRRPPAPMS